MNLLINPIFNSATLCTTFNSSRTRKSYSSIFIIDESKRRTRRYFYGASISSILINDESKRRTRRCLHGASISSIMNNDESKRRCECYDLHDELVPYANSWSWQKTIVKERKELIAKDKDFSDTVIILQHQPVYTLGTGSSEDNLRFSMNNAPFDIYRTERGGEVTYHGPGQLVMYPILNLTCHKKDLHWYLRALEEVVIRTLWSTFFIKASRIDGLTGVWVGDQKLAAIGVKVSQWVTYHGLALNVTTDLSPFNQIVPCGIQDRQVGSVKGLLSNPVMPIGCETDISCQTYDRKLMDMACESLIKEFSEVFQVELCLKQNALRQLQGET